MNSKVKVALISGIFGIVAGTAGTSYVFGVLNINNTENNNTNNNTIIITNDAGEEEIVTAEDYIQLQDDNQILEQDKKKLEEDNKKLEEDYRKLQESIAANQQNSRALEEQNADFMETLYDGDEYTKYDGTNNPEGIKIGGESYTNAVEMAGKSPFVLFNLNNSYNEISFDVGRVDDSYIEDRTLRVYLNNVESGEYAIDAEVPLTSITVQVAGASTMKIELVGENYTKYGLVNFETK